MTDLDKSGHGFQRVRTYLGPSLGWVDELVGPSTLIKTAGTYNVQPGDSLILVEVAAGVQINLPDVRQWVQQTAYQPATGFDRSITIKDLGGNAANFNIIVAPFSQQYIDDIQNALVMATARATIKLIPLIDLSGWASQTATGSSGGGGGGGDVFKAGNNTFTGINTFLNAAAAITPPTGDSSQSIATTEFVKNQNYLTSISLTGYAPLNSPVFSGDPQAPTPAPSNNSTSLATTAYVQNSLLTKQPLDDDLTSIANQTTNNSIYYRLGGGDWHPVVIGGGLVFSGGTLSSTAGGGNVNASGTPVNGQIAQWISLNTIKGVDISSLGFALTDSPVFTGDPKAPTPATADNDTSIATTAFVKANLGGMQPLDGDLTAIAALTGTNTIYYRSGTNTWDPVTFSGLNFAAGILSVTVGGGNVSNSGTPIVDQIAQWTDATHIKGASVSSLGLALLASPVFTGDPRAPTPTAGDNDTSIATTAFVQQVLATTVPPGTLMLFQQSAAPTGWTKQTTHDDKALRVVSGAAGDGGTLAFSGVFAKTAVDAHTLDGNELTYHTHSVSDPGHAHGIYDPSHYHPNSAGGATWVSFDVWAGALDGGSTIGYNNLSTMYVGTGVQTYGAGVGIGIYNAGANYPHVHGMDIRVQYVDLIIAMKN
jgi:hypothetical protein